MFRLLRLFKVYGIIKTGWDQLKNLWNAKPNGDETMNNAVVGKPWWSSITVVLNTVAAVVSANNDSINTWISAHPVLAVNLAVLANILLRFRTNQPVK